MQKDSDYYKQKGLKRKRWPSTGADGSEEGDIAGSDEEEDILDYLLDVVEGIEDAVGRVLEHLSPRDSSPNSASRTRRTLQSTREGTSTSVSLATTLPIQSKEHQGIKRRGDSHN